MLDTSPIIINVNNNKKINGELTRQALKTMQDILLHNNGYPLCYLWHFVHDWITCALEHNSSQIRKTITCLGINDLAFNCQT